jgi:exopolysaccharide production protein ExoQ
MRYPGFRRALAIVVSLLAGILIVMSDSKTALALAIACPILAVIVLAIRRTMRISPAVLLVSILLGYIVVSELTGFTMYRVSYILYGDPTFTGRSYIWDFAFSKIADRPLLGWGYQSFWLVGSDAPSVVDAPGFVKSMPNAHNGYFDTMLELGYLGWGLLMAFILTTLHAVGRVADRYYGRAWSMLTIALYVIIYNGLESFWMRGYEFLWVVFLVLAVDIRRYLLPLPITSAAERAIRSASPLAARVRLRPRRDESDQEASRVSRPLRGAQPQA